MILASSVHSKQIKQHTYDNVIRIKFNPSQAGTLDAMKMARDDQGFALTGIAELDDLNRKYGATSVRRVFRPAGKFERRHRSHGLHLWYELTFKESPAFSLLGCISEYQKCEVIDVSEAVLKKTTDMGMKEVVATLPGFEEVPVPNDPQFSQQWHYHNAGQTGGTPGADISLVSAWDQEQGSSDVIVAIIDGGIQTDHEDLAGAMWINQAEMDGETGVDDDNNGFVDDIYGYGFGDDTGQIFPHYHGTHVAGTVGALTGNGVGVSGVAGGNDTEEGVRLMSLAGFGNSGTGGFDEAFIYAADMGAVISQNSWGYTAPGFVEQSLLDAIDYFIANAGFDENGAQVGPMAGGLVVFAAGNSGSSADYYPGFYEPVLAVASTDHNDQKSGFSNYGQWVDISAPGSNVLSTYINGGYNHLSGTSMACPHVSGVAALVVSKLGGVDFSTDQLRAIIEATADDIDSKNSGFVGLLGSGRLNASNPLMDDDGIPPAAIADLSSLENDAISVTVTWTATGFSGTEGTATVYDLRYSENLIDEGNFDNAIQVVNEPSPKSFGETEIFTISGLTPNTTYYFAIKARDYFGNTSEISNVVSTTTDPAAEITVQPSGLYVDIDPEQSLTETLTISNTGDGPLDFAVIGGALQNQATESLSQEVYSATIVAPPSQKGEPDLRVGPPVFSGKGDDGDGFGYRWIDSNESEGPVFNWIDISESGTQLTMALDDFKHIDLPFSFPFYGEKKESVYISSNGFLTFSSNGATRWINDPIPSNSAPHGVIAPFWDDFNIPQGGAVYYHSFPDKFVVQYHEIPRFVNTGKYTFQVILHSNGRILYQYLDLEGATNSCTVGLENFSGDDGIQVVFNNNYLTNNLAIQFDEGPEFIGTITPSEGTLQVGESIEIQVPFSAEGILPDTYSDELIITSNDPVHPITVIPTIMHVNGVPNIESSDQSIVFGDTFITGVDSIELVILNTGNDLLKVTEIEIEHQVFYVDPEDKSFEVWQGEEHSIYVKFSPQDVGLVSATMNITSNDEDSPNFVISIEGAGILPPVVQVPTEEISINIYPDETLIEQLKIQNTGGSPLSWQMIILETNETESNSISANGAFGSTTTGNPTAQIEIVRQELSPQLFAPLVNNEKSTSTTQSIPFSDGFEPGNLDKWVPSQSSASKDVVTEESAEGARSLRIDNNSTSGHFTGVHTQFESGQQPTTVSFHLRPDVAENASGYFVLSGSGGQNAIFFLAYLGKFYVNDDVGGDWNYIYEEETWYKIDFRDIDWQAKEFDYYVNEELVKEDISFRSPTHVEDFGTIHLYNFHEGSAAYWDNIFLARTVPWMTITPIKGIVPEVNELDVDLNVDATDLEIGLYEGQIVLTSNDPITREITLPVQLNVVENLPPKVVAGISNQELPLEEGEKHFDISGVFEDPRDDILTITSSISNSSVASVEIVGDDLVITPVEKGEVNVTITADDGRGLSASSTFKLFVIEANKAPIAESFDDLSLILGEDLAFDLGTLFHDPDGDPLNFVVTKNGQAANVTIEGLMLSVESVEVGETLASVSANDGKGGEVSILFKVVVESANIAPIVSKQPETMTLEKQGPSYEMNLMEIFSDPDGDDLSFEFSAASTYIEIQLLGSSLTIVPMALGATNVSLTATDSGGKAASTSFNVEVKDGNTPPQAITLDNIVLTVGNSTSLELSDVFSDNDGDALNFSWTSSNSNVSSSLTGTEFILNAIEMGETSFLIEANDNRGGTAETWLKVTSQLPNEPPVLNRQIATQVVYIEGTPFKEDLTEVFDDGDGDPLTFEANTSNSKVEIKINGNEIIVSGKSQGLAVISITANDGRGGTHTISFEVEVKSNTAPVASAHDDLNLRVGDNYLEDVGSLFSDAENDILTYTIDTKGETVKVDIQGDNLSIGALAEGETLVSITANDGNGGTAQLLFKVRVILQNRAPVIKAGFEDITVDLDQQIAPLHLSSYFSDPDFDRLAYSAVANTENVVALEVNDNVLSATALGVGSSAISITANDQHGAQVTSTFNLNVRETNVPPIVVVPIRNQLTQLESDSITINLEIVFSDPNNDKLKFSTQVEDNNIIEAIISESMLILKPRGVGVVQVAVVADDQRGGVSTTTFELAVELVTSIEEDLMEFGLTNNPNPFSNSTNIHFNLPIAQRVEIVIQDVFGKQVKTLLARRLQSGSHIVPFDGIDLMPGIYLYHLLVDDQRIVTRKMIKY